MDGKISCIIVDDESKGRRVLRTICEEYCPDVEVIAEADSAALAEDLIREMSPDFIFLDVRMPLKDGFQFLDSFDKIPFQVIFTTAYEQYAVKAFKFSAVDYLLKPIDIDELVAAVNKVKKNLDNNNAALFDALKGSVLKELPAKIAFATSDGFVFLAPRDIVRCEAYGNYTKVFMVDSDKHILISKTLKHFEEVLEDYDYFRIHKSHMVNMDHVKRFLRGKPAKLVMIDGSEVEVSVRKREELVNKLTMK